MDELNARRGALLCERCSSRLAILPGCSFGSEERAFFEDLVLVVAECSIAPDEAKHLGWQVAQTLRSGAGDDTLLERLTTRMPGLLPVQAAAGQNRQARLRALRLLRAILEAKSLGGG